MAAATYVSHEIRDNFFHAQRSIAANKMCFDCERRSPMWATVSFGTFMCLDCSGYHRRMGVHVSFVRSTDMDEWTEEQLLLMQLGGNSEARKFFKQHGVSDMMNIDEKYKSKAATLYKAQLTRKVQAAKFDSSPFTATTSTKAKPTDEFGLDDLAKLVGTAEVPPIANAYTARTVAAPSPVPDVSATAATMPPPAPTTGLLQTRPTVTLGSDSSGPSGAGGSTITSKLSSRKAGATGGAKKATRLGATKVKSNFDDFDNIPFENAKPTPGAATDTSHSKQIDDDEALARAMQQAEEEALGRSFSQHATIKAAPFQTPSAPAADSLNKYKNSKSISSDNFFAAEQSSVDPDKIRQFSGSQSISSDMYYGDGRARSASTEASEQAAYQLELLKAQVTDKAQQLKSMTSSFFTDLQNRYS
ncbi:hypothetical protein H310_10970 [Aphanomyces invadans]|uniref:Arf-GAP domain-containing protein n=1 Tax=Aphanomyces invadans TaxID=157072 RepID=A0A024TPF4_9STRA|nr:hypothetical protein H310_10970 [Aphanomyces invadans]ETV95501.1 hypothetical protein H310_10970 [Aphanomyces invadans]|eukprot:XP_008875694.1 hypothetical protein H310_10970 [Aphanomyces invadans]